MVMYFIQINKLIKDLKKSILNPIQNIYIEINYKQQTRRTTNKLLPKKKDKKIIWYECFVFVIDTNELSDIVFNIYDNTDPKKTKLLITEKFKLNQSKMVKENTEYIELQHGLIHFDKDENIKSLTTENESLTEKNTNLQNVNTLLTNTNKDLKFDYLKYKNAFDEIKNIVLIDNKYDSE